MTDHVKKYLLHMTCIILLFVCAADGQSYDFDGGAALRQNVLLMRLPSQPDLPPGNDHGFGISETRARLYGTLRHRRYTFNAALETRAGFYSGKQASAANVTGRGGSMFGESKALKRWDLTTEHLDDASTSIVSRIDRLDVTVRVGPLDIDVGRQPLSMGTSHFVGVLDVVAPFAPGDLDNTYKPGVDAVRVRKGIGMTGESEIIAVGADDINDGALLARYRNAVGPVDVEMVGGRFRRRAFGGVGWEGGVSPYGYWGEVAVFEYRDGAETVRGWSEGAVSCVAGLDYYIEADFVVGGALMYQDFGVRDADDLVKAHTEAPFREGWLFLGSAGYAVLTVSKELHPLVQFNTAGLINLVDESTLWQPRITISTGNNTDIAFYGWIGAGKGPVDDGGIVRPRSEFGGMPDGGGFYARWFF